MVGIEQLKTYRARAGLTQQEAAEAVGVARETWAFWESGARRIGKERLPLVAEKTGIPRRDLRPDLVAILNEGEG
jgi:transcriptional regulator with XRE-family HTH domain